MSAKAKPAGGEPAGFRKTHLEVVRPIAYHSTIPPKAARVPRHPMIIAGELRSAAECLTDLAEDFAAGCYDDQVLPQAAALLVGAGRLIVDLRLRRGDVR